MNDPITELDGIHFRGAGDVEEYSAFFSHRRFDGYYGIQYTHRGNLLFAIDRGETTIHPGPCAFLSRPGHEFTYGAPPGESRSHCYLCFDGPTAEQWNRAGILNMPDDGTPVVPVVRPELFLATMRHLLELLHTPSDYYRSRPALLLLDLLLQLRQQPPPRAKLNVYCEQYLRELRNRILRNPEAEYDFSAEAANLSISYSHFRRIFREFVGRAPGAYLLDCRLNAAAAMLTSSVLPVSEVSHRCGFADEFYFSRLFHRHLGMPPSAYRKEFFPG